MNDSKECFCDLLKKRYMDLYKELPTMKLLVLLLTEIFNILQIRKMPQHLSPALKCNNQKLVSDESSDRFSVDISEIV